MVNPLRFIYSSSKLTGFVSYAGASFLDIFVGHNLAFITHMLGPIASVIASSATMIPEITLTTPGVPDDQGQKVPAQQPDQWAMTSVLANSGALLTASWRILNKTLPEGSPTLIFLVDGSEGQIRIESDDPRGCAPHVISPERAFLNGKAVDLSEEEKIYGTNVARNWAEFAKPDGVYPTLDDAVQIKAVIEAIRKSASTGQSIKVQEFL